MREKWPSFVLRRRPYMRDGALISQSLKARSSSTSWIGDPEKQVVLPSNCSCYREKHYKLPIVAVPPKRAKARHIYANVGLPLSQEEKPFHQADI